MNNLISPKAVSFSAVFLLASWANPSLAARSNVSFPKTEDQITKASINIPQPSGCKAAELKNLFARNHWDQVAVCGALKGLYQEAVKVRDAIFLGQDAVSSVYTPEFRGNQCFSARRTEVNTRALDAVNKVDGKVRTEEARIEDLCDQAKQNFETNLKKYQGQCPKEFSQGALQSAQELKKQTQEVDKENEDARKLYQTRLSADRAKFKEGITSAQNCKEAIETK